MKRREFFHQTANAAGLLALNSLALAKEDLNKKSPAPSSSSKSGSDRNSQQKKPEVLPPKKSFRFIQPFDGAVLHENYGMPVLDVLEDHNRPDKKLRIAVSGEIPDPALKVELINSKNPSEKIPVKIQGTNFMAQAIISDVKTEFTAFLLDDKKKIIQKIRTRLAWIKNSSRRYRFQIDDNIFCMRDIFKRKYKSLFDSPYFKKLKEMHGRFDTKFVLNLFYTTPEKKDFDLSKFPDTYKEEWADNANWLKLAFHSGAEFPDQPLLVKPLDEIKKDLEMIEREILRFAGEESYTKTALLHWGTIRKETLRFFIDKGWKTFSGSGWPLKSKDPKDLRNYQLPPDACRYLDQNDSWYNFDNGLLFSKIDLCCNRVPLDETVPLLRKIWFNRNCKEVMDLGTHEQYFWKFYKNYQQDHWMKVEKTLRFMLDHGYRPVFPEEDPYNELVDLLRKK